MDEPRIHHQALLIPFRRTANARRPLIFFYVLDFLGLKTAISNAMQQKLYAAIETSRPRLEAKEAEEVNSKWLTHS